MIIAFWRGYTSGPESVLKESAGPQALAVFVLTMVLLFSPKSFASSTSSSTASVAAASAESSRPHRAVVETFFSALIAPVMMLFHTRFVIWNILGKTVGWNAQRRGAQGTSWDEAISVHGIQTLLGVGIGLVTAFTNPTLFAWLSPVLAGLWFSIPISVWTSRLELGMNAKREKLFLVPEESSPPPRSRRGHQSSGRARHPAVPRHHRGGARSLPQCRAHFPAATQSAPPHDRSESLRGTAGSVIPPPVNRGRGDFSPRSFSARVRRPSRPPR